MKNASSSEYAEIIRVYSSISTALLKEKLEEIQSKIVNKNIARVETAINCKKGELSKTDFDTIYESLYYELSQLAFQEEVIKNEIEGKILYKKRLQLLMQYYGGKTNNEKETSKEFFNLIKHETLSNLKILLNSMRQKGLLNVANKLSSGSKKSNVSDYEKKLMLLKNADEIELQNKIQEVKNKIDEVEKKTITVNNHDKKGVYFMLSDFDCQVLMALDPEKVFDDMCDGKSLKLYEEKGLSR